MQNKFGLKDFILLVLVLFIGISLWLRMFADDRKWDELKESQSRMSDIESQLARLQRGIDKSDVSAKIDALGRKLDAGIVVSGTAANTSTPKHVPNATDQWRPDVEITYSPAVEFNTDPYEQEGFSDGGVFTEIFEGQPPKITPYLYADVYGRRIVDIVCQSLGQYDHETLEMEGMLAEAWQYDPNGMWLRVKIVERARFSNGDPVLAEDARWTFEDFLFNPEIECERFRSVYNAIADIQVIGDPETSRFIEYTFKEPRFDNFEQAMGYAVLPKSVYSKWAESPAKFNEATGLLLGSGPFKLERVDPEDQWAPPKEVRLVRNELYWGPRPAISEFRIKTISNGLARLTAYTNGEGDMMRPSSKQYDTKSKDESFLENHNAKKWYNMRGGYGFIAWQCGPRNGKLTPFHDKRVRMAMTHLIDRNKIRRDIGMNLSRAATGPFLTSTPQANPAIRPWPYDLNRSRELLAEAGWVDRDDDGILENEKGDEFEFEITFGNGSEGTLRSVEYIRAQCAKVGIRMKLNAIDWSVLTPILQNRDFDAVTFAWSASSPENDPNQIWHSKSIENQGDNFIQWANADADRLIEEGRRTLIASERMKVWHQLHTVFHEEQPYTFMSESPWTRFTTKRMQNVQGYPSGISYEEFWISKESNAMQN